MKNILVLTDFSDNAKSAEFYALQLATLVKADIILYNVYQNPPPAFPEGYVVWPHKKYASNELRSISNLQERAYELKGELAKISNDTYHPRITHLGDSGNLTDKLHKIIAENNTWLVVMGSKGESFASNIFLGSNVFKVIDAINCPLLIVPHNAHFKELKKIAYAEDLLTPDIKTIEWLKELVELIKANLFTLNISTDISPEKTPGPVNTTDISPMFIKYFKDRSISESLHTISKEMNVDALALKHRQHGFFDKLFHGSVSRKMIRGTEIPILIFPGNMD